MPGRFGGVAVEEPKSRFGGVAVEDAPVAPATPAITPAQGGSANPARARRQAFKESGLTAEQAKTRREAVTGLINQHPGFTQLSKGVDEIQTPGKRKEGLHNVVEGGGKFAGTYMLPPALVAAPLATATALGTGMVAAPVAEQAAKFAGAEDDTAALVGDAAGIAAGGAVAESPKVAASVRGAARGAVENVPFIGKWLKGAWEGAERAAGSEKPSAPEASPKRAPGSPKATKPLSPAQTQQLRETADRMQGKTPVQTRTPVYNEMPPAPPVTPPEAPGPRRAPGWVGNEPPTAAAPAPVESIPSELPSGRKVPTAEERLARGEKKPEPSGPVEDTTELDAIAKGLGGKDFASLSGPQQATVRRIAAQAASPKPAPAPPPAGPKPAPASAGPSTPTNVVEKAEVVTGKPKTVNEMLDAELKARREAAPKPAPSSPALAPETPVAAPASAPGQAPGDYYRVHGQVKKAITVANDLHGRGVTAKQLEELPLADRKEALGKGHSDETFNRILFELRGLETGRVKPTAAAPAAGAPPPAVKPVEATVRTPNQTKAKVRYKISEASDLKTSFDPDYNTEIGHQPRDTTRVGSRQRVEARKADMDPNAMGHSTMAGDGAPITRQNHAVTRNHGTQALKENYQANGPKAQEYRDWVAENASLAGLSADDVAGMKEPVLHRELVEDWKHEDVKKFADEANMSSTARMSEAELAKQMAQGLNGPRMGRFKVNENGIPDAEFVREMIKGLPVEEQGQFSQRTGEVSQLGARMVRNAVFERAYTSTSALETMAESTNPQVKNISNAMLNAAPEMAKLNDAIESGNAYDLKIGREVGHAMETIERLRQEKKSVPDWLKQKDMMGRDPVVSMLVHFFGEQSRRPTVLRAMLKNFADEVRALGKPNQDTLFGEAALPTKEELLDKAYKDAIKARETDAEPSLFGDQPAVEQK